MHQTFEDLNNLRPACGGAAGRADVSINAGVTQWPEEFVLRVQVPSPASAGCSCFPRNERRLSEGHGQLLPMGQGSSPLRFPLTALLEGAGAVSGKSAPLHIWAISSAGQSRRLITARSRVQLPDRPPAAMQHLILDGSERRACSPLRSGAAQTAYLRMDGLCNRISTHIITRAHAFFRRLLRA